MDRSIGKELSRMGKKTADDYWLLGGWNEDV